MRAVAARQPVRRLRPPTVRCLLPCAGRGVCAHRRLGTLEAADVTGLVYDDGRAQVWHGDARALPLADESVHLIVTSPPYNARINYDGKNGHPYTSIGRYLVEKGLLDANKVSMQSLCKWLRDDPERVRARVVQVEDHERRR